MALQGAAESLRSKGDRGARRSAVAHHEAPPPGGRSDAGGSREKTAGRAKPVAAAVVMPKHDGFAWGGNPAPPAEARRGVGKVSEQTRPACRAEALPTRQAARAAGTRSDGGAGIYECMTGRPAQASEWPGVQPG